MTALIEVELACDGPLPDQMMSCPLSVKLFADSAKEARKIARADGWIQSRRKGKLIDVCPDCQEVRHDLGT